MKGAAIARFGDVGETLTMREDWPLPERQQGKDELLIRVQACSVAPGDAQLAGGRVDLFLKPPSWPYIPGMDVCGTVMETDVGSAFEEGDCVVASNGMMPIGGMAEFMVVKAANAALKPEAISVAEAASCPCSAVTAVEAVAKARVEEGKRVLVLGGSGGVGSAAVQIAKVRGASFVACTTTQTEMLTSLGADAAIDYRESDWWDIDEYREDKFDCLIDCVGGGDHFAKCRSVLKSGWDGGRFVAVSGDDPQPEIHTAMQAASYLAKVFWRPLWTFFYRRAPSYIAFYSDSDGKKVAEVLEFMHFGQLRVPLDPSCPLPFTEEGVRRAMKLQAGGHAHGKVVVQML